MDARKRLLGYIGEHKWRFIGALVATGVVNGFNLYFAKLFGGFTDAAQSRNWTYLLMVAAIYLGSQLPRGTAFYGQYYLMASATNRIAATIRDEIYVHLHKMSLNYFERNRIGHLMSRMTNDVGLIQNGSAAIVDLISAPMMLIGGLIRMFMLNWFLAIVLLVFAPAMSILISTITRKMRKLTVLLQVELADVTAVLEETIAGIRIVKSFGMERYEIDRFANQNRASLKAALRSARRSSAVTPVTELVGAFAVVAVVLVGGYLISHHEVVLAGHLLWKGNMTYGKLMEFAFISFYVAAAARSIGRLNVTYHQTMAGMERISEILNEQPDMENAPDAIELAKVEGRVEFRDVSFSYQTGEQVLSHISLTMEPGTAVAVVGPSGAGKSTIANVIPRFYDVSSGAVLVDGHDVRSVRLESLRSHIGIVPQETILFSGTIRDNIAYGKPNASDEEVEQAARAANAHDFVTQFEHGYNTVIGERGVRLSGGERQRISIARAILKDPRILILDEATSSLDATSERLVQEALECLMRGRTTLVIAHRLSTITKADEIVVLGSGSIVEHGSFSALMAQNGLFAKLYRSQFDLQTIGAAAGTGSSEATLGEN